MVLSNLIIYFFAVVCQ